MNQESNRKTGKKTASSRREFLKHTGTAAAGAAFTSAISSRSYAAENNTINLALVGCGGRGAGAAADAMSNEGPTKLIAMADVFDDRLQASLKALSGRFSEQVDVPPDRQFLGMDAFKKAIDLLGPNDVVLLATPPCFRPTHLEYAVAKGVNVFMEKAFAVDAPGIRRLLKAGEEAKKKNLKIVGGLMLRHAKRFEATVNQIHNGAIGDVITCLAYRVAGPVGFKPRREGMNELAHQIQNYSNFTWLNGSFILDWLIHNLDVCCWVKDDWPVSAQGQGGRQTRTQSDQLFDHFAVEYTFGDGTRMFAQGRHMPGCWGEHGCVIHGTKGCAVLGEGKFTPLIYKGYTQTPDSVVWRHEGKQGNFYQFEHDALFDAIRQDKPHNETERCAYAAMTGILGRMAAESGKLITWDEAMASELELAPGLDRFTMDSDAPVQPDSEGRYPIAMPGFTKVL
jgi:predicted dehydrogenase